MFSDRFRYQFGPRDFAENHDFYDFLRISYDLGLLAPISVHCWMDFGRLLEDFGWILVAF